MEKSLQAIFGEVGQRPCTIVQGLWPNFGATLKFCKKFNFDRNQLKHAMNIEHLYTYQEKL